MIYSALYLYQRTVQCDLENGLVKKLRRNINTHDPSVNFSLVVSSQLPGINI